MQRPHTQDEPGMPFHIAAYADSATRRAWLLSQTDQAPPVADVDEGRLQAYPATLDDALQLEIISKVVTVFRGPNRDGAELFRAVREDGPARRAALIIVKCRAYAAELNAEAWQLIADKKAAEREADRAASEAIAEQNRIATQQIVETLNAGRDPAGIVVYKPEPDYTEGETIQRLVDAIAGELMAVRAREHQAREVVARALVDFAQALNVLYEGPDRGIAERVAMARQREARDVIERLAGPEVASTMWEQMMNRWKDDRGRWKER